MNKLEKILAAVAFIGFLLCGSSLVSKAKALAGDLTIGFPDSRAFPIGMACVLGSVAVAIIAEVARQQQWID